MLFFIISPVPNAETLGAKWDFSGYQVTDADVANALTLDVETLELHTSEPAGSVLRDEVWADFDTWNPAGLPAGTGPYRVLCATATCVGSGWKALYSADGKVFFSSIATPTLDTDELDDQTSVPPSTLLVTELKNTKLSNASSGETWTWTLPEHTATKDDWSFMVVIEDAEDIILEVNAADTAYLNGTALAQGQNITNTADTVGESMYCYSTEVTIYCESKYANFGGV